jgi:hypothetical protein
LNRLTQAQVIDKNMNSAMEINQATEAKDAAREFGFKWQMSLYGVLTDRTTNVSEYRRIEVLANEPYTGVDIELIYRFFRNIKPAGTYTIWLYNTKTEELTLGISFN